MLPTLIPRFEFRHWPEPLARLDPSGRVFALSLAISVVIHALVLSIHFNTPDRRRLNLPNTLDVVFVNSKTVSKPLTAEVLAQANLDRGGNTDLERRAKTRSPLRRNIASGKDTKQSTMPDAQRDTRKDTERASRRVKELEHETRELKLLSQLDTRKVIPVENAKPQTEPQPKASGMDRARRALEIARLEAQLSRSIDEYNKRPRKRFVGARASEYRFAQYVEDWRRRVERIGNLNYPESARGRVYGSLRLSVSISADGSIAALELERPSGKDVLDSAARRIVRMGAPYARFPESIRRDTDILVITRTWHFARGDRVFSD